MEILVHDCLITKNKNKKNKTITIVQGIEVPEN
jgi:hypothetical protein